jgi:hypothetical protein
MKYDNNQPQTKSPALDKQAPGNSVNYGNKKECNALVLSLAKSDGPSLALSTLCFSKKRLT